MEQDRIFPRSRREIGSIVLLLCGALLLLTSCESVQEVDFTPACPPGVGRGISDQGSLEGKSAEPSGIEARELLENPNLGATPQAVGDLEVGIVDQRLIAALGILIKEHRICVETFKEGHYFVAGVPDGPRIP